MIRKFYFDTYALVEVYKGNPSYQKYAKDVAILLNRLNVLEFAYFLMREERKGVAESCDHLLQYAIDYDDEILLKAAEMKLKYLKQHLSFIDCIGYLIAKKNKVKFLTGDEQFRNKDNVEFIK